MERSAIDRRGFLRLAALAALAACGKAATTGAGSPTPTGASPSPSPTSSASRPAGALAWRRLTTSGPPARRDHSFAGSPDGSLAVLFGGRDGSTSLGDTWVFDATSRRWSKAASRGPSPRFGASASFVGDRLLLFGGQGGLGSFFDDLWSFDPAAKTWTRLSAGGAKPAARYGAGGTTIGTSLLVSHGFTDSGRFDDAWAYGTRWSDVSPPSGPRPVKRCLHRWAYLPSADRVVLFGGQTNGVPHLGDTWTFDVGTRRWTEHTGPAPSARNLFAAGATNDAVYVFGGAGEKGKLDDLWSFDGTTWTKRSVSGAKPSARSGIEGAMLGTKKMLVFGGTAGSGELRDLWELTIP